MKTFFTILVSAVVGAFIGIFAYKCSGIQTVSAGFSRNGAESAKLYPFLENSSTYPQSIKDSVYKAHYVGDTKMSELIGYYDTYCKDPKNFRLKASEPDASGDSTLKSFFVSRILIDTIFKYNPKANGVRLFMAKHSAKNDGKFTFVIRGVNNSTPFIDEPIFDYVDTCPNNCK